MPIWSKATLRLFGQALTQEEIDKWFGKAPRIFTAGNQNEINGWFLESDLEHSAPLDKHITDLTWFISSQINAFTDPTRRFDADIFCSFSSENGQGSFAVSPKDMLILAKAGVGLQVSLYPQPDTDGDLENADAAAREKYTSLLAASKARTANAWRQVLCQEFDLVGFVSGIADEVVPHRFGIKCQCPLHRGEDHSFSVDNRRKRWHCFGACSKGGDAVTLLALLHQSTEEEALERLARMIKGKDE